MPQILISLVLLLLFSCSKPNANYPGGQGEAHASVKILGRENKFASTRSSSDAYIFIASLKHWKPNDQPITVKQPLLTIKSDQYYSRIKATIPYEVPLSVKPGDYPLTVSLFDIKDKPRVELTATVSIFQSEKEAARKNAVFLLLFGLLVAFVGGFGLFILRNEDSGQVGALIVTIGGIILIVMAIIMLITGKWSDLSFIKKG